MWSSGLLAYIDPATGGLVLGGLASFLAWAGVGALFLRRFFFGAARLAWRPVAAGARAARRAGPAPTAAAVLALGGGAVAIAFAVPELRREDSVPPSAAVPENVTAERVLAIGLDGADPRVIGALFEQGKLPNMKAIADRGSFAPLTIPNPAQSPVVWAALATGQNPGRNGIYDFIGRNPEKYLPKLALLDASRHGGGYKYPIRAKAFWDVATANGVETTVIRWPMTFPPPEIRGRMLAGLGVPDVRGSLGRYTFFTDGEAKAGDEGGGVVQTLELSGGEAKTELGGPQVRGLTGVKTVTTPLTVKVDAAARTATVALGGKTLTIREGTWSDLVDVTFESGLFSKYRGQVRLYLQSVEAPFALLATSVEMHPEAPVVPFTHPPDYAAELSKAIGPFHTLGMPEDTKAYGNGHMDEAGFLALCEKVEAERRAMLLHELGRFDRGVLAVVFDTLDRIQHMTPYAEDLAASPMGRYLIEFDAFLGDVTEKLAQHEASAQAEGRAASGTPPPKTEVILFSDHGFSEFRRAVDLNRWLVETGEMAIDAEKFRARESGTNGELYRFVDWEKTNAYAVGFAGIFVNVKGREGKGKVDPAERRAVAERIRERLSGLTDPANGEKIVHRVYLREELYEGAQLEEAPDLVIGYKPGYRGSWQSAIGGLHDAVVSDNEKKWQRDHIVDASFVDGTLVTSFRIHAEKPHAFDLAPTFLSLLGLPVPAEMEGRPLNAARTTTAASAGAGGVPAASRGAP